MNVKQEFMLRALVLGRIPTRMLMQKFCEIDNTFCCFGCS